MGRLSHLASGKEPGEGPVEVAVRLMATSWRFKPGNRLRLEARSQRVSWREVVVPRACALATERLTNASVPGRRKQQGAGIARLEQEW